MTNERDGDYEMYGWLMRGMNGYERDGWLTRGLGG